VARLGLTRRVTPSSLLQVSFARQTADAADIIRYDFGVGLNPTQTPLRLAARDPLVDTSINAGWQFERPRTRFGVSGYRTQERYEVSKIFNRTLSGADAHFDRRLQRHLSLGLAARFENEHFDTTGISDHNLDLSVTLNWFIGQHLQLALRGDRYDRSGNGAIIEYTENRIGLQATYGLLGGRHGQ